MSMQPLKLTCESAMKERIVGGGSLFRYRLPPTRRRRPAAARPAYKLAPGA